ERLKFVLQCLDELAKATQWRQSAASSGFEGAGQRIPKGRAFFARDQAQGVDGHFANAARRGIQDAQQGHVVSRKNRHAHVGENVFDLGAFVEAEAAEQTVANSAAAKRFFEGARLGVGAVKDGDVGGGIDELQTGDLGSDVVGFGSSVTRLEENK